MSSYRERRGTPVDPGRRGRKGFDINQLPIWSFVAILLVVVAIGGALWLMTRRTEGAEDAAATATAAATAGTTPRAAAGTAGPTTPTPVIAANTPTPAPGTQLAVGIRAVVVDTGADQLSIRGGPGVANARLKMVGDGTTLKILEGPETADGKAWWRVQLDDGTIGWVVGDFLRPAP